MEPVKQLLVNPYRVGPPVTGGDFYGRFDLLNQAYQALQRSNVVTLQGQRRIGKTSFLKQLVYFLNQETDGTQKFITVSFDVQRYVQDTLAQFQSHLAIAIGNALRLSVPDLTEWEANPDLFLDTWLPKVLAHLNRLVA